ncbi:hypothetical protein ATCC19606_29490 [Acinetobacter baumannii]|uniref:Uncharacterized protein n=1 Tax=Acinetobacter baumannii TaxID=470 RepID=A0A6F8TIQ6_ACIBA|nr:hypothetical protein ATCC19606_29490 [Acinetobacter baumannii]
MICRLSEMTFLSCNEIYELMTDLGYTQTNTRKYAHEFKLKNGQYIYVKRLEDNQKEYLSRLD